MILAAAMVVIMVVWGPRIFWQHRAVWARWGNLKHGEACGAPNMQQGCCPCMAHACAAVHDMERGVEQAMLVQVWDTAMHPPLQIAVAVVVVGLEWQE